MILEVNDRGEIVVPAELVRASPRSRVAAERLGDSLVIRPAVPEMTPRFIAERFPRFPGGPTDPAMTFRREDLYGDDGR